MTDPCPARRDAPDDPICDHCSRHSASAFAAGAVAPDAQLAAATSQAAEPANIAGSYLVGQAAAGDGDLRRAADEFEAALAAEPENLDLRRQVFELLLASGEFDRAVASARSLQASGGANDWVDLVLALDAARHDRWSEAIASFEEISAGSPAGPVQPILLAWARFGAGSRNEAVAALATAEANTGLARLRDYHRAVMQGLDGRPAEGIVTLRGAFPELAQAPARVLRGGLALQIAAG